jgi:uracil-DNA glycosylase
MIRWPAGAAAAALVFALSIVGHAARVGEPAPAFRGTDTRGQVHALGQRRWPVLVTYHPAYLLRSPGEKRKAWQDLLLARSVFSRLQRGEQVLS